MGKQATFGEAFGMFLKLVFALIVIRVILVFAGVKYVPIIDDIALGIGGLVPGLKMGTGLGE